MDIIYEYRNADGIRIQVPVTEEVAAYLTESDDRMRKAQNVYNKWNKYELSDEIEPSVFRPRRGSEIYRKTPEELYLEEEFLEEISALLGTLTPKQERRLRLWLEGFTCREIAEIERADFSSVAESIRTGKKKIKKEFRKEPPQNASPETVI